ncbi:MAG: Hsp70 family protein, partial [Myxococcales bacterium]|nr:Hsp70 family protein [Myxococcales bacterium]
GGTAHAFYLGVEGSVPAIPGMKPPLHALCVAPFGIDEGAQAQPCPNAFGLVVGESVRFRFFRSSTRRQDAVGTLLSTWDPGELSELPSLEAVLPAEGRTPGEVVTVRLQSRVTEVGTLEVEALPQGDDKPWRLTFDVRGP